MVRIAVPVMMTTLPVALGPADSGATWVMLGSPLAEAARWFPIASTRLFAESVMSGDCRDIGS